jgi:hypothetical protein
METTLRDKPDDVKKWVASTTTWTEGTPLALAKHWIASRRNSLSSTRKRTLCMREGSRMFSTTDLGLSSIRLGRRR